MKTNVHTIKVSKKIAKLINQLHSELNKEFKSDFAYSILGMGYFIATSNYQQGIITPETEYP